MRSLLLAAGLALAIAVPAQAQTSFSPLVGYDLELSGLSVGLAFEVGAPLENLPLTPSIRPLIEYVFADDFGAGFAGVDVDTQFIRAQADLIGRFELGPDSNFSPYVKAGAGIEFARTSVEIGGVSDSNSNTELAINIGGGAEFTQFFVEGGLGLSGVEGLRIRAGYRF
ncbi:hypothetical protein [Rubrivirga sp.]|uniref:hypothetical protein n=1 Tax=Rubrivirga sp. TaxID=1885344 RepID=UPI003C774BB4